MLFSFWRRDFEGGFFWDQFNTDWRSYVIRKARACLLLQATDRRVEWLCTLIHQMHWHPHSNSMWYRVRVRCFSVRCPYHGNSCKILAVTKRWNETHWRYVEKCHFVLSFYPRRQEFESWMHWLLLLCHRGISDWKGSYMNTYISY
jgi:hypothetical protein